MEDETLADSNPGGLNAAEIWGMIQAQRKIIVACVVAALLLGVVANMRAVKLYRADAVIQISSVTGQEVAVDGVVDYDRAAQEYTFAKTQLDLLQSRGLREEVIRRHEALGFAEPALAEGGADSLGGMLRVTQRRDTELVDVSVTDTDPERAARLANLVAEVYREQNLGGRRDSAREAKEWLQQQLLDYKQRIVDESAALIAYQTENGLADAEEDITRSSATMDALNIAYGEVNTQRVLLETTVRGHRQLLAAGAYEALAKDMNTALVVQLMDEYSSAATENAGVAARYLEKMPEREYSEAKLRRIETELRREVERTFATEEAQLEILRAKEASLSVAIDGAQVRMLQRQAVHEDYERLRLQLERSKQFYSTLSQRDGELDLASRTHLSNVRVVDEARPNLTPVSPQVFRNMLLALVFGVALGIAVALIVEYVDDTISSPFDVSTYLPVPLLGFIPHVAATEVGRNLTLYTHEHPNSPAAEAVRAIRTVLELNPNAKELRRVLITSSEASEGKTSTVVSLAVAFATRGRRVLIVDADLRRPRLHHVFDVQKGHGLSGVLKGVAFADAVIPSGIPGIDLLPAGARTDGPNELLASPAMAALLDELETAYDIVLIDSPPSGMIADAAILSRIVDGVVFVVRDKTVSRWLVRDVVFRLQQIDAPLLGVIINDVDLTGRKAKYKYYYYDSRYKYDAEPESDAAAK